MELAALIALVVLLTRTGGSTVVTTKSKRRREPSPQVRRVIEEEAARAGVPLSIALAFADLESGFNPNAEGDLDWAARDADRYRERVIEQHAGNPYVDQPELWHSYGLYQLLAPYHVREREDPRVLLNPRLNARRGLTYLAALLRQTGGNVAAARLRYTGGRRASDDVQARILTQLDGALARWKGVA